MAKKAAVKISYVETIRNRVKELRFVPANSLISNKFNWRRHPKFQRDVISDVLAEIGFAGAVLARETEAGLEIIDGHLRAEVSKDGNIPVLVLDVDEAEAKKLLATFDPIGALAVADDLILQSFLAEVQATGPGLVKLLNALGEEASFGFAQDGGGG